MTLDSGQVLLLTTLVAPALGAVVAAAMPATGDRGGRILAAVAAGIALVASVALIGSRERGLAAGDAVISPWTALDLPWVPGLDLRFHIGVDGISYPLVVLTTRRPEPTTHWRTIAGLSWIRNAMLLERPTRRS